MQDNINLIDELSRKIEETVSPLADPRQGYALLDFPDYANVGDSLIWLGELAYFARAAGRPPSYVCKRDEFDAAKLRDALPRGPIYLSGGGNFGDLWPRFQEFRIAVLEAFPDREIIQLPQTIFFKREENAEPTRAAIARHRNVTLIVRDQPSLEYARRVFDCEARLCPDMAFAMGALGVRQPPVCDAMFLLRTDQERQDGRGDEIDLGTLSWKRDDWIHDGSPSHKRSIVQRVAGRLFPDRATGAELSARFQQQAEAQMERGIGLLQQGRVVVTDRLHGHILSVLLGLPNVVMDNSYGKVRSFAEAWTASLPFVRLATDLADVQPKVRQLLPE